MIDPVAVGLLEALFVFGMAGAGVAWVLEEYCPEVPHAWLLSIVAILLALLAFSARHPDAFELLPYLAAIGVPVYFSSFARGAWKSHRERARREELLREQLRRNRER